MRILRSFLLPVVAVSMALLVVWYTHGPAPVVESSMAQVHEEAERSGYQLMDVESLWELYRTSRDTLLLVDTRQEWEFRAGHIDGSINFPMEPTWRARWLKKGELKTLLAARDETTFVFY